MAVADLVRPLDGFQESLYRQALNPHVPQITNIRLSNLLARRRGRVGQAGCVVAIAKSVDESGSNTARKLSATDHDGLHAFSPQNKIEFGVHESTESVFHDLVFR